MPPPSSDKQKWWLEGGKAAKIIIPGLEDDNMVMNPWRPINPFEKSNEPEFVSKMIWKLFKIEFGNLFIRFGCGNNWLIICS